MEDAARENVSTHSRPKAAGPRTADGRCSTRKCFNTQPPEGGWPQGLTGPQGQRGVSTHSRPKAAGHFDRSCDGYRQFQHTAARRRLVVVSTTTRVRHTVSTHSRPKAAGTVFVCAAFYLLVSTHSRPKAAGAMQMILKQKKLFQHTAARRRLVTHSPLSSPDVAVSTHSRPKAAGLSKPAYGCIAVFQHTAARRRLGINSCTSASGQSFNTQPPEGGWLSKYRRQHAWRVSTHSRPKAAGALDKPMHPSLMVSTHSRPKAAGYKCHVRIKFDMFQHTAARRRLVVVQFDGQLVSLVSTHSRPKAAGNDDAVLVLAIDVSTHSRPKAAGLCA